MRVIMCVILIAEINLFQERETAMRLDKYLADMGTGTRSEKKKQIKSGNVTVSGEVIREPGYKVGAGSDIAINGESIMYEEYVYYILTNNHVIYKHTSSFNHFDYTVRDCYGQVYSAEVVTLDPDYDLAVVKFKSNKKFKVLPFADKNPI